MNWSDPIDIYCERIGTAFWAEPVNALTNAAFLLAAVAAYARYRKLDLRDGFLLALIFLVALIAIGSFTFHTVATRGSALADTIPIALFVYAYLGFALCRYIRLSGTASVVTVLAFAAATHFLSAMLPRGLLNGSLDYAPPLVALYVVGALTPDKTVRERMLAAAMVFTLSLVFRTVDLTVCGNFPLGTHFLWHLINAFVLSVLLRTAIDARRGSFAQ